MRVFRAVFAGIVVFSMGSTVLYAESLRSNRGPAETPPATYTANQYVDSKGCVFIRAGYGGKVTWVPRVTRSRRVVCSQTPTLVAGATKTTAPRVQAPQQTAAALSPQPRAQRKSRTRRGFWNWWVVSDQPRQTVAAVPAPVVVATVQRPTTQARRKRFFPTTVADVIQFNSSSRYVVRNGPQADHPGAYVNGVNTPRPSGEVVQGVVTQVAMAEGYKSIYSSDKSASRRGVGTAQGQASMDLIWTNSVPRKLIDTTTGNDVAAVYPKIIFPYTSVVASSKSYQPVVKRKRVVPAATAPDATTDDAASPINMSLLEGAQASAIQDTVATLAVDEGAQKTYKPTRLRYVQVATFGVPENAKRTLARFDAGGLTTHSRPLHRNGNVYEIVLLGPFQDQAILNSALAAARSAGFSDAFFVK